MKKTAEVGIFFAFLMISIALPGCQKTDPKSDLKIVGGRIADPQPFMAGLTDVLDSSSSFCGASFITDTIALTAAHCVFDASAALKVSGGITLNSDHGAIQLADVKAVRFHPKYSPATMDNDIAILFLKSRPQGRTPVVPISMNRDPQLPRTGSGTTVIGWGNTTSYGVLFENELRQVDVKTLSVDKCRSVYGNVTERQICAGDLARGGLDSCQGDSGGPLIVDNGAGQKILVGIVSWGEGCAWAGKPGVYTRVSSYAGWVDQEIARFTRTSDMINGELLSDYFKSFCYVPLKNESKQVQGDASLAIRDIFAAGSTFRLKEASDDLPDGVPEKQCSFEAPGNRKFTAKLVAYPAAGSAREARRLEILDISTQKLWISTASAQRTVDLACKFDDEETSQLALENGDSGTLEYHDKLFFLGDEVSGSGLGNAKFSCAGPGMTYSYYEKTGDDEATLFYLKVDTTLFDGNGTESRKYFKMARYTSGSNISIAVASVDGTSGTLTVKNTSARDLHTWELQCDKSFDLTDEQGATSHPTFTGNLYRHKFARPAKSYGSIAGGDGVEFKFTAAAPLGPDAAHALKCMVNRVAAPVTFRN